METKFGGKLHHFYGPVVSDLGKKSLEWDLNEWRWDGDLFLAAPLNPLPSDCKSRQCFPIGSDNAAAASNCYPPVLEELMPSLEWENRDSEKKRRVFEIENEEASGSLNLKLGGQMNPVMEEELLAGDPPLLQGKTSKKTKFLVGPQSSRAICQVEDCKTDLSNAKDYHRRHKVCDFHSKATCALVGNAIQRFCQQCSRFHVLKEFDEGKRSCRRRLAGHNRRRRKTHPENVANAVTNNEWDTNYLLISLLRILSNIHSNSSDPSKDQDLLSHLLSNLSNLAGASNVSNNGGVPSPHISPDAATPSPSPKDLDTPTGPLASIPASDFKQKGVPNDAFVSQFASRFPTNATKLSDIDLNDAYDGSQDCTGELTNGFPQENNVNIPCTGPGPGPLWLYKDSQQSSCPPQISTNSGSTFSQSPSTSSGETQGRTDRIVFKLFGKDPSDFPLALRKQILDWLSNSPTDIESYIRPGCIILTIYIHMDKSRWDELYCDLASSLSRFLDSSTDPFWKTGWVYTRVQNRVTFLYNGQLVLDTPLPMKHHRNCRISRIKPIAVTVSETVRFSVKGFDLSHSNTRFLCTLEGNYLAHENFTDTTRGEDSFEEHDEMQSFSFSCVIPDIIGRGFIEVEDHGMNGSFFPFIVAEDDVCSEIRSLESIFEDDDTEKSEIKNRALDFIHEMGWLLHRNRVKNRLSGRATGGGNGLKPFSFERFRWLAEFSIDHDWSAVVRKLLNILFDGGSMDSNNLERLGEIGLLHRAVRRKCRPTVKFLLSYSPSGESDEMGPLRKLVGLYLFRPDAAGPGGLTPLHVAACLDGCEGVVDALTEDSGHVGINAWKTRGDDSGLTPHDYACLRGHHSYNTLVDRKLDKKSHIAVDIFDIDTAIPTRKIERPSKLIAALECENEPATSHRRSKECGPCRAKRLAAFSHGMHPMALPPPSVGLYRPVMVTMVAIAAVCVCTALLFKTLPHVHCLVSPFRWELLKFGFQ